MHFSLAQARADAVRRAVTTDCLCDGAYVLQQALREEMLAERQYLRVLRIFSKLVIEGEIPDEDEWREIAGG